MSFSQLIEYTCSVIETTMKWILTLQVRGDSHQLCWTNDKLTEMDSCLDRESKVVIYCSDVGTEIQEFQIASGETDPLRSLVKG